jgi:hypothetical protein
MTTERFTLNAGIRRAEVRHARSTILIAISLLAVFAASAQAHTVTATATCKSVTFNWEKFSSSGSGNGRLNTPKWAVAFNPEGGSTRTLEGVASFSGSSYSQTVAIPSGNGWLTASSSWSSAETRDGNANSWSTRLTIANCPAPPAIPVVPPPATSAVAPPWTAQRAPAKVALSTIASTGATFGSAIRDTAVLSGGSSPTGTITFSIYSASDLTCSKALRTATVAVSGDGSYVSPPIVPASAGSYQWVAIYGGDENNQSVSAACNDPAEQSTVARSPCLQSQEPLHGLTETAENSLSLHLPARGVKSVTVYLDGHKLVTLTKPTHQKFSLVIDVRKLSYGVHRLRTKVTMRSSSCASAVLAGTFIHVKPGSLTPKFAG